jgi:glycosyltransferase involved in cell wall biosynthesis
MNIGIDGRILDWHYSGIAKYVTLMLTFDCFQGATVYFPSKTSCQLPEGFKKKVLCNPFKRREAYEQLILPFHLAKDKIDLFIQPYNFGIPILYFGKSILLIFDIIPLVFKNYFFYARFPKWARWNYKFNTEIAIWRSTKIICDSNAAKQHLLSYFPKINKDKLDHIYYGFQKLDLADQFSFSRFKKEKQIGEKYLLANAGLEERKNAHLLINAFAKIQAQLKSGLQLVFTGYNPHYLKQLTKIVEKYSLQDKIIFTDSISEGEKNFLIKKSLCVINPSQLEGFGIPLLEAAHFMRPIICSDIPAFIEVGENYPIYFKDNNENDLIDKISYFLKNNIAEEKRAKEQSPSLLNRFTYEQMETKWRQVINSI